MSSKVSFWLLLRLAILLAAFLAQSGEGASYQDFLNRHIAAAPAEGTSLNAYCNRLMQQRGMTDKTCKTNNTFINEGEREIQKICQREGTHIKRNLYDSRASFHTVICTTTDRKPECKYVGKEQTQPIRVACDNRLPVHYEAVS